LKSGSSPLYEEGMSPTTSNGGLGIGSLGMLTANLKKLHAKSKENLATETEPGTNNSLKMTAIF